MLFCGHGFGFAHFILFTIFLFCNSSPAVVLEAQGYHHLISMTLDGPAAYSFWGTILLLYNTGLLQHPVVNGTLLGADVTLLLPMAAM